MTYPNSIICLTEESVETLFLLNRGHLVKGVSSFVKRPHEATQLPKVSLFTSSKIEQIIAMQADLIIGFSDIQKDIARELIERGQNVLVTNQRSLDSVLKYIQMLAQIVNAKAEWEDLNTLLLSKIEQAKSFAQSLSFRPKIYFEEWDEPLISGIGWVSDIIELCGGEDIFRNKSQGILAKDRFVAHVEILEANPDIIIGCWCGKKVRVDKILSREGYQTINAVRSKQVLEVEPEIFLQPGPAVILDGIDQMIEIIKKHHELGLTSS
jgi:iron complex transport system substrate-binding protein